MSPVTLQKSDVFLSIQLRSCSSKSIFYPFAKFSKIPRAIILHRWYLAIPDVIYIAENFQLISRTDQLPQKPW